MRYLLITLLLIPVLLYSQDYNITADTTDCTMSINTAGASIKWMIDLSELRYVDRSPDHLIIFDGASSVFIGNSQISNYASIAALKTDLDTWADSCAGK